MGEPVSRSNLDTPFPMHTHFGGRVDQGEIAPYVLVPGSKAWVAKFASLWDELHVVAEYREFLICAGLHKGVPVSACSTGIGGTSVALAVHELVSLGAHTLIRVGVTGTLQSYVSVGDLTIATAAVRADRISAAFVPNEIPALSSSEVVLALAGVCQQRGFAYHSGTTATNGTFYCGEGRPGADGYTQSFMASIADDFTQSGILDWDTETSVLFTLGASMGARVGRINGVVDSPFSAESDPEAEGRAVEAALDAVLILAEWDRQAGRGDGSLLMPHLSAGEAGL